MLNVDDLEMPSVNGRYLIDYLYEIGPTISSGDGQAIIPQSEIIAWMSNTGVELEPWEIRIIRILSGEYLSEHYLSLKHDRPCPWDACPYLNVYKNLFWKRLRAAFGKI